MGLEMYSFTNLDILKKLSEKAGDSFLSASNTLFTDDNLKDLGNALLCDMNIHSPLPFPDYLNKFGVLKSLPNGTLAELSEAEKKLLKEVVEEEHHFVFHVVESYIFGYHILNFLSISPYIEDAFRTVFERDNIYYCYAYVYNLDAKYNSDYGLVGLKLIDNKNNDSKIGVVRVS